MGVSCKVKRQAPCMTSWKKWQCCVVDRKKIKNGMMTLQYERLYEMLANLLHALYQKSFIIK